MHRRRFLSMLGLAPVAASAAAAGIPAAGSAALAMDGAIGRLHFIGSVHQWARVMAHDGSIVSLVPDGAGGGARDAVGLFRVPEGQTAFDALDRHLDAHAEAIARDIRAIDTSPGVRDLPSEIVQPEPRTIRIRKHSDVGKSEDMLQAIDAALSMPG